MNYTIEQIENSGFKIVKFVNPNESGYSFPTQALMQKYGASRSFRISDDKWALCA